MCSQSIMNKNKVIIVGSGASIRQSLWTTPLDNLPIWPILQNQRTIAINWAYKWLPNSILYFADARFLATEYQNIKDWSKLITRPNGWYDQRYKEYFPELPKNLEFHSYPFCNLSGESSIGYALEKLQADEIYLLGFDCGEVDGKTHFYDDGTNTIGTFNWKGDIVSGVGKNQRGFYNTAIYNNDPNQQFVKFEKFKDKIINVSIKSRIEVFKKITYDEFYKRIA